MLMLFALRGGAVSHVAPAREIGILIGTWLGVTRSAKAIGCGDCPRPGRRSRAWRCWRWPEP
jgi:hypothetical protein